MCVVHCNLLGSHQLFLQEITELLDQVQFKGSLNEQGSTELKSLNPDSILNPNFDPNPNRSMVCLGPPKCTPVKMPFVPQLSYHVGEVKRNGESNTHDQFYYHFHLPQLHSFGCMLKNDAFRQQYSTLNTHDHQLYLSKPMEYIWAVCQELL